MPLEIEIKLKVESHAAVRRRLRALRAKRVGKVRETNIFFEPPVAALRRRHLHLRVRLETRHGKKTALVTFKLPPGKDALRSREAFDVHATPVEQVVPLAEALGFRRAFSFEKDWESWEMGGCKVELDTLPHFGAFMEIEGPSQRLVQRVQKRLGLAGLPAVRESYSKMVGEFVRSRRGIGSELRMPSS